MVHSFCVSIIIVMQHQNIMHLLHVENELPFLFHPRMLIITPSEVDFLLKCTNHYPLPNTLFKMNINIILITRCFKANLG
jgi:hypothetical protein